MASLQEILSVSGSLENAESIARQLSKKDPKFLLDFQLVLSAQGKLQEAWKISCKAHKLFPHDHRVNFDRGWLSIARGDLLGGLTLMEQGRPARLWGDPPLNTLNPVWNGLDDLSGKIVLILGEGGLGDQIFSVRFAKVLSEHFRDIRIILACHSSLMSIFSRVSGLSAVIDKQAALASYFDYWIPSFSLPKLLFQFSDSIDGKAYIKPASSHPIPGPQIMEPLQNPKVFKVGIRWAGNPQFEHDQFRSVPPELFFLLSDIEGIRLFSFQRDNDLIHLPENVIDLRPFLQSWEDTASLLQSMDLVISSCTSLAHLSAAMGKPTDILVPIMPYYLWAPSGNSSIWYNSAKLYRQTAFGSWNTIFQKLKSDLTGGLS